MKLLKRATRPHNFSMFLRILAFYLLICVFLIVLYSGFCTVTLYNSVASQLESSTVNLMSMTDETAKVLLDSVQDAVNAAGQNPTVISAVVAPDISRSQRNYTLVDFLRHQVTDLTFVRRALLYVPYDQTIFTSEGTIVPLSASLDAELISEHAKSAETIRGESGEFEGRVVLRTYDSRMYCCFDFPLAGKYSNGTILYEIDGEALYGELNRQTEYDIYVLGEDGLPVFGPVPVELGLAEEELSRMRRTESGVLKNPGFHGNSLIYYYMAKDGWLYLYPVPTGIMRNVLADALKLVLPMFLISLILSAVLASYLSNAIYRPVRRLISLVGRGKAKWSDFVDTTNEMEFLGMAYEDAVRTNERLQNVVARSSDALLGRMLRHLMLGREVEDCDIRENLQVMNMHFAEEGNWIVIACSILQKDGEDALSLLQTDLYRSSLETLANRIAGEECGHTAVSMESGRVAVVLCFPADMRTEQMGSIVSELIETTRTQSVQLPCIIHCGVGKMYHHIRDIRYSWQDAAEKLNYQAYMRSQTVSSKDVSAVESDFGDRCRQMVHALFTLEPDAQQLASRVLEERFSRGGDDLRTDMETLLDEVYRCIEENDPEGMDSRRESARRLALCSSSESMRAWAEELCDASSRFFGVCNSRKKYRTVIRAKEYVDEHYTDPNLTLNEAAQNLDITAAYLSRLFHEYQQHSFVEYVNGLRVRRAVFMLTTTDLSVSEIGFRCGFSSAQNFSRVFKKYMELTPSQYRESHSGV